MKQSKWLLLGYCIPFSFLALLGDVRFGTPGFLAGYGLLLLGFAALCRLMRKHGTRLLLLMGNALSCGSSLLLTAWFQTETWLWYFKPLSAEQLILLLSCLAAAVQLLFVRSTRPPSFR